MIFSADLANLLLYCAQQLGVTLGVGAETIMLAAYLIAMRDGVVDEKEGQYARAIKRVLATSLSLIIVSGLGITLLHALAGEGGIIFTPAFLFKWLLVALVVGLTNLRKVSQLSIVEGVIGGTWFALFLVHILAPVTSWINLGVMYVVWLVGFVICWELLVRMRSDKKGSAAAKPIAPIVKKVEPVKKDAPLPAIVLGRDLPHPTPAPVAPPPAPKPVILQAPVAPKPIAPPPVPVATAPAPIPPPIKKEETIITAPAAPAAFSNAPGVRVTDTPFLPKVPPLQPIPTIVTEAAPIASTPASSMTTPPGGTSATPPAPSIPLIDGELSAINVMPKNPADKPK